MSEEHTSKEITPADIHMPPNSFWPIVLAFGFVLTTAGLALTWPLSLLGVVICLISAIGWVIDN